jgi:hypothetical protein
MVGVQHGDNEHTLQDVIERPTTTKDQNCIPPIIDYEDVHRHTMKENGEKMKVIFNVDYKKVVLPLHQVFCFGYRLAFCHVI